VFESEGEIDHIKRAYKVFVLKQQRKTYKNQDLAKTKQLHK